MSILEELPLNASTLSLFVGVFVLAVVVSRSRSKSGPLPPGPPAEPILGHARVIPKENAHHTFIRWSKEYKSDIIGLGALGQHLIVLNSVEAANDLLEKRGINYSDRPRLIVYEVLGWGEALGLLRWGPKFRTHRRMMQKGLQKSNVIKHRPLQERAASALLKGLLERPSEWSNVLMEFPTTIVLEVGFGIEIDSDREAWLKMAADAGHGMSNGGPPGSSIAEILPFLRYLPSIFHDKPLKFAFEWRFASENLREKPYAAVVLSGERRPSTLQAMLDHREDQLEKGEVPDMTEDEIKNAAAGLYAAGAETTWATLITFVFCMVLHPELQVKAQRILDEVVGRQRLPNFEDRPKLRYIDYLVYETLRWCPVTPLGIPHRSVKDDVYRGYFIPAGSVIIANAYAMTHDGNVYANPDEFDPDRYIPIEEGGRGEPLPVGHFGFGRRICIGQHTAEASLWIAMATILSTLKLEKKRDDDGNEITPVVVMTSGVTTYPKLFPCQIRPRDDQSVGVIRNA